MYHRVRANRDIPTDYCIVVHYGRWMDIVIFHAAKDMLSVWILQMLTVVNGFFVPLTNPLTA